MPAIVAIITVLGSILVATLTPGSFLIHPTFIITQSDSFKDNNTNYYAFKIINNGWLQAKNVQINIDSIDKFSIDSNDNLHMLRLTCPESNFNSDNQWKSFGKITLDRLSVNVDCNIVLASKNNTQIFDIVVTADNAPTSEWFGQTSETKILSNNNAYLTLIVIIVVALSIAITFLPIIKSTSKTQKLQIFLDSIHYKKGDTITSTLRFYGLESNDIISIDMIDPKHAVIDSKNISFGSDTGARGVVLFSNIDWKLEGTYTVKATSKQSGLTSTITFDYEIGSPLEQLSLLNPRIVDSGGTKITSVKINQKILVALDLVNVQNVEQPFVYILQIQTDGGITASMSNNTGAVPPKQTLSVSQEWIPSAPGKYTAQIFIWKSIEHPNALASPISLPIEVV